MAENSYVEVNVSPIDFPKPFQRTGKFPLDRTDLFSSYEDAVKYAAGNREDPDSRGLCGTSYVGQTITVYENDAVSDYKILPDRTLRKIRNVDIVSKTLEVGETELSQLLPADSSLISVNIYDAVTREQILTDVAFSEDTVIVSLASAYENPLDVVILYCSK